jgi:pyridoxal phosphate enzyme (YggS family)
VCGQAEGYLSRFESDSNCYMDRIAHNWQALNERVEVAASRSGRSASEITVVAVTKTRSAEQVSAALDAGATDVGENRVQEAACKRIEVPGTARWHLIGPLQRNKASSAVDIFDVVHSIDSNRLADALNRRAAEAGGLIEGLVQVNSAGAAQQSGIPPDSLPGLLEHVAALEHVSIRGLMTIAAHTHDEGAVRECFRKTRELAQEHHATCPDGLAVLSMGMSGDFEIAIEEGATLIRVGTVLFGERQAVVSRE